MIDRFVCVLACMDECKEHTDTIQVSYYVPFVGTIVGSGITEYEADKVAIKNMWEAVSKFYVLKMKEMIELEKLWEEIDRMR